MHSEEYLEARREFWNCILMSPLGLFWPLVLAFRDWLPIMNAEKAKEAQAAQADGAAHHAA